MEKGSFSKPTETRDLSGMGTVEVVRLGDITVSRSTFRPGWRWSEHVKPIVGGDSCQTLHHSFVTSGRLAVRMDDGSQEEFGAGDIWVIPPGHDAWVVGNEAVVTLDFSSAAAESTGLPSTGRSKTMRPTTRVCPSCISTSVLSRREEIPG